jgi:hypothetical protein
MERGATGVDVAAAAVAVAVVSGVVVAAAVGVDSAWGGAGTVDGATSTDAAPVGVADVGSLPPAVVVEAGVPAVGVGGGAPTAAETVASGPGGSGASARVFVRAMSHQTMSAVPKRRGPASSATSNARRCLGGGLASSSEGSKVEPGVGGVPTGSGRTTGGAGGAAAIGKAGAIAVVGKAGGASAVGAGAIAGAGVGAIAGAGA